MDQSMLELNQKIDLLTNQVAYLTEQARLAEQSRQARDELVESGNADRARADGYGVGRV